MTNLDKNVLKDKIEDILNRDEGFREDVRSDELIKLFIREKGNLDRKSGNKTFIQEQLNDLKDRLSILKDELTNPEQLEIMTDIEKDLSVIHEELIQ